MSTRTIRIVTIGTAVVILGAVGLTSLATGDASGSQGFGFLDHMRKLAHHMHGGGHGGNPMAELIEELRLTPAQVQRMERIHAIVEESGIHGPGAMHALHDRLIVRFEQGAIEAAEVRGLIDEHVERMRRAAYAATDEMIALVNELDAGQREILLRHLRGSGGAHNRVGH